MPVAKNKMSNSNHLWSINDKKMIVTRQLIIFLTCSLALEFVSQLAQATQAEINSALSFGSRRLISDKSVKRPLSDLSTSANTLSGYAQIPPQPIDPVIYHSTINKSPAGTKPYSPFKGSSSELVKIDSPKASHQSTPLVSDLATAAGHHHGHAYGKYYEYREVPKKKTWKFGYKRGNHKHTISRHEHGKAGKHPHFKTKVHWHDKKSKGKGIHLWDYNHHDKKHYHHG